MDWFGRASINFTTSPKSLGLKEKDGKETDLLKVCQSTVPPCQLNPLLFNGHAQTMWTAAKSHGPPLHYKRKIFEADHAEFNGSFAVDFAVTDPSLKEEADETLPRGRRISPRTSSRLWDRTMIGLCLSFSTACRVVRMRCISDMLLHR